MSSDMTDAAPGELTGPILLRRAQLITACGVRISKPRVVQAHDRLIANSTRRPIPASTPGTPPAGRNPASGSPGRAPDYPADSPLTRRPCLLRDMTESAVARLKAELTSPTWEKA
jgi:hypothetical protein